MSAGTGPYSHPVLRYKAFIEHYLSPHVYRVLFPRLNSYPKVKKGSA